ncbi:hypothetical protein [Vreelandella alkaliphila]|uniref:hypothetical protein n=1 Tax=Vreelandella alkaliphila TaxID=272774 RepID=UPI003F9803C3
MSLFEESLRLARTLRNVEEWTGNEHYITHDATDFSLWIGNGFHGLCVYCPNADPIQVTRVYRYGFFCSLIIWFGGARSWYKAVRIVQKQRTSFKGGV